MYGVHWNKCMLYCTTARAYHWNCTCMQVIVYMHASQYLYIILILYMCTVYMHDSYKSVSVHHIYTVRLYMHNIMFSFGGHENSHYYFVSFRILIMIPYSLLFDYHVYSVSKKAWPLSDEEDEDQQNGDDDESIMAFRGGGSPQMGKPLSGQATRLWASALTRRFMICMRKITTLSDNSWGGGCFIAGDELEKHALGKPHDVLYTYVSASGKEMPMTSEVVHRAAKTGHCQFDISSICLSRTSRFF